MTKILFADDINIGFVDEFTSKVGTVKVKNIGTEKVVISDMVSNSQYFVTDFTEETIQPEFPANSTIYLNDLGRCQDITTGQFYTTNQGYGILGTTDSDGLLTLNPGLPEVSITSPAEDAEYKIGASVTVTWTASNIENLDLVVESGSGLLAVENIDASLGAYTFNLTADYGTFYPNDAISISLTDCLGIASDTVNIVSIATLTMETPTGVVAGEDYDYEGTSNGDEVELFYSLAGEDDWTSLGTSSVVDGDWTITGSIPDAGTYDFKVEDTTNPNGYVQVDNITVAGAYKILATVMYSSSSAKLQLRRSDTGAVIREKSLTAADYDLTTIAMDDEYVFLLSQRVNTLECFRISDLSLVWTHGVYKTSGSGNNYLTGPVGVCVYGDYVYIADTSNYRIKKISRATGAFVSAKTGVGSGSRRPEYIASDGTYVYSYYRYSSTNSEMNILRIPVDMSSYSVGATKTVYGGSPTLSGIIVDSGVFYFVNVLSSQISKSSAWDSWGSATSISFAPIGGEINGDVLYTTNGTNIYLLNKSTLATISSFAVDSGYNFKNVAVKQ